MTRIPARTVQGDVQRPDDVGADGVLTVLRVPPELAGMRLDRFVQTQLKRTSRTRAQLIVERSAYSLEGKRLRPGERVRAEQRIALWRPAWDEEVPDIPLPVVYEDDALLVVDKPPGIPVHPTARYFRSTVVKLLERDRPGERFMLGHRIDRETSGVLLLTKTSDADRHVKRQFMGLDPATGRVAARRLVDKQYLAITVGWPDQNEFRLDEPLELDPESRLGVKMRIAAPGTGMASATACEVAARAERPEDGRRYALVRCALETGRQHQIRIHLASAGLPLVGDKLYGPDDALFARGADGVLTDEDRSQLEIERHALHAATLELDHPTFGRRARFSAPLSPDLRAFWEELAVVSPGSHPLGDGR